MPCVYTHENRLLVENAKNLLQRSGVPLVVKNEYAAGGAGDLAPSETWLELWVDELHVQVAKAALAPLAEPLDEHVWLCSECGESNVSNFEICWQCQSAKPNL